MLDSRRPSFSLCGGDDQASSDKIDIGRDRGAVDADDDITGVPGREEGGEEEDRLSWMNVEVRRLSFSVVAEIRGFNWPDWKSSLISSRA